MLQKTFSIALGLVLTTWLGLFLPACLKVKAKRTSYAFEKPSHFPDVLYDLATNPISEQGFLLGKMLFFDKNLSSDKQVSCGTCHQPVAAFADVDRATSVGVDQQLGPRNTPPIFNLAWQEEFFWDGRHKGLDLQPIGPLENPIEMNMPVEEALAYLNNSLIYQQKFSQVFGLQQITDTLLGKALAQYMLLAVSAGSKYDQVRSAKKGVTYTTLERMGRRVFAQNCTPCHDEELFTDNTYRNVGLPMLVPSDSGRYLITKDLQDLNAFKVPSLRNLAYTAPYMHDGRFATLEEVMDFYVNKVEDFDNLDPLMRKPDGSPGMDLSEKEIEALLAFLAALNDPGFINDPKFRE